MTTTTQQQSRSVLGLIRLAFNTLIRMLGGASMIKFLIRRILAAIPVLFAIVLVTFTLSHLLPGGPFNAVGQRRMPDYMVEQLNERFGLNKPVLFNTPNDGYFPDGDDWKIIGYHEEIRTMGGDTRGELIQRSEDVLRIDLLDSQFFNYVWGILHGDFGPSLNIALRDQNVTVTEEIAQRLPVSMQVGLFAVILGFLIGVPLGVLAAVYHNTLVDYVAMFFAVLGQATPGIVLGPILIIVFAVELGWVPVADQSNQWNEGPAFSLYYLQILALPVLTLGTGMSATIARLTRASLLQVLHEDYVRTARAKGLRERVVIYVHALKNAMIPVATIIGPLLAGVLTGTFVVELIFVIPGLGRVFVDSVNARDYTMIMGVSILYSVFLISGNILVDIMYTWLDPRIRFD
jgi:oligopeptide transport system permease protein